MDAIRDLIQTIVVIVVMAVLIEMLLPKSDMRGYVKMVMGLLVIVAVLQAFTGVMKSDIMGEIPSVRVSDSDVPPLEDIMAAGQAMKQTNQSEAVEKYSEGIARQVLSLARLNNSVQPADARVKIKDETNNIENITIIFSAGDQKQSDTNGDRGQVTGVQPVVVEIGDSRQATVKAEPTPEQNRAAAEVAEMVAEFYNLRAEQVKIQFIN